MLSGLNEDENPASLDTDQLRTALNCCRLGNLTGTRPGLAYDTEYTAAISGTPAIQGLHEFRASRDATRHMISIAGGTVRYDFDSALTTSGTPVITAGANNVWTMAEYQNLLWGAGGLHGTDTIWSWDGNTSNPVTNRSSILPSMNPKYVFQKFNALHFGGFDGSTVADNPMLSRYVDFAHDATDVLSWPSSNSIPGVLLGENPGVGTFGGEYHTGFGSYQDNKGDFLLWLTNRRIIVFKENPNVTSNANRFFESDAIANGCVDQRAFVDLGYDQHDSIFVSEDGVHSMALSQQFGNRENAFLSYPIRKTWQTLNRSRMKYITADYWPDEGLILIAVSTGSNTTHDLILVMDIRGSGKITPDTVKWYKWHLNGVAANVIVAARDPDGLPTIYIGGNAGEVAQFTRTVYSDLGASVAVEFATKDEDYGYPSIEKSIGDTFLMVRGSGTYSPLHTYILDDGIKTGKVSALNLSLSGFELAADNGTGPNPGVLGVTELGSGSSLTRNRILGVGSSFTISHEFSHAAINEPFFVGSIVQDIAQQGIADGTN